MTCINKITSPSNRIYIGQTINIRLRINHYRRLHFEKQKRLYASVLKYGWNNHKLELIEECSIDLLNERERYWQDFYNVIGCKGLNIRLTNSSDKKGTLSVESKNKISFANSGKKNGMYGKKITEEMKEKQRFSISGEKNYLSKWLINLETGIFYPCLNEAGNSINMEKRKLWANIQTYKRNKTSFIYA